MSCGVFFGPDYRNDNAGFRLASTAAASRR